jgi:DNA-binding transcriptional ArsR family regulator
MTNEVLRDCCSNDPNCVSRRDCELKKFIANPPENPTQEELWDYNHEKIRRTIAQFLVDFGRTPMVKELAAKTKLSQQSVRNHLKKHNVNALSRQEMEQFRILSAKVFSTVAQLAIEGDLNAAKLFFQVVNKIHPKPPEPKRDPYFSLFVGNTSMAQSSLDRLDHDGQAVIEDVLKTAVAQKERESEKLAESGICDEEETRKRTWEHNHFVILQHTGVLMMENGRMPNHTELAERSGLTRQTIARHLREYSSEPLYEAELEQLRSLAPEIMNRVAIRAAVNKDLKAAKLFYKVLTEICPPSASNLGKKNDYLVLNEIIITKELMKTLSEEQEQKIYEVLKNSRKQ